MSFYLIYSYLKTSSTVVAYIDPNTVHTVFSGIMPMLIAGITAVLAVIVWPLIIVRARLGRWLRGGSRLRWAVLIVTILALLAGIALVCGIVFA